MRFLVAHPLAIETHSHRQIDKKYRIFRSAQRDCVYALCPHELSSERERTPATSKERRVLENIRKGESIGRANKENLQLSNRVPSSCIYELHREDRYRQR